MRLHSSGYGKILQNIFILTPDQQKALEEAQTQYAKGYFLSNEEANKQIDEFFANTEKIELL
jgi:EAL domain-containing protein (putative c-di-GMP-specific phosphodiesterase class I)